MTFNRQAKFILVFSNLKHISSYTHQTRAYLTGRWMDALACGAIVAGIVPSEPSIARLFWDGATLDLESTEIEKGLGVNEKELSNWTAEKATYNYKQSLECLYWRWRFIEIAKVFQITPKNLLNEIYLVEHKLNELKF
ncbi:hypothetical protein [Cycloclasticus zancles]|nr:hypothetical protein [Cycloclasticus zancles]KXJ53204.1 MAG: hypothetical protein AXW17_06940 [Colwellia sp. Phe_37]